MTNVQLFPDAQIIVDAENFLSGITLPEYNLTLLTTWTGGPMVSYTLFKGESVLFSGDDFKPSPMYGVESLDSLVDLLSFLVIQPGDTDDEYFANYNDAQMDFARSYDAEVIKGLISDFEDENSEFYQASFEQLSRNYFSNF